MMYLGKTVGYAVHALCCLENARGEHRFVQDIADATGIKKPYLARIVNQLVHRGLLLAKRGYRGGVTLARPAGQISLIEIVSAVEGEKWSRACFFGLEHCPCEGLCPAHEMWGKMRVDMESVLRRTTLAEVAAAICPRRLAQAAKSLKPERKLELRLTPGPAPAAPRLAGHRLAA